MAWAGNCVVRPSRLLWQAKRGAGRRPAGRQARRPHHNLDRWEPPPAPGGVLGAVDHDPDVIPWVVLVQQRTDAPFEERIETRASKGPPRPLGRRRPAPARPAAAAMPPRRHRAISPCTAMLTTSSQKTATAKDVMPAFSFEGMLLGLAFLLRGSGHSQRSENCGHRTAFRQILRCAQNDEPTRKWRADCRTRRA